MTGSNYINKLAYRKKALCFTNFNKLVKCFAFCLDSRFYFFTISGKTHIYNLVLWFDFSILLCISTVINNQINRIVYNSGLAIVILRLLISYLIWICCGLIFQNSMRIKNNRKWKK